MTRLVVPAGKTLCVSEPHGEVSFALSLGAGSKVVFMEGVIPYITSVKFTGDAYSAHAEVIIVEMGGGYALPIPDGVDFS